MLKRVVASLGVSAVVALALPTTATAQMMDKPEGKEMTISGTVIDLSCKFAFNLSGDNHRTCAQVCADAGVPLAILGDDGTLYLPVSTGMPGGSENAQLKPHAEHKVTVKGTVFEAGGAMAIQVASVSM
jgi:hypothetical protein